MKTVYLFKLVVDESDIFRPLDDAGLRLVGVAEQPVVVVICHRRCRCRCRVSQSSWRKFNKSWTENCCPGRMKPMCRILEQSVPINKSKSFAHARTTTTAVTPTSMTPTMTLPPRATKLCLLFLGSSQSSEAFPPVLLFSFFPCRKLASCCSRSWRRSEENTLLRQSLASTSPSSSSQSRSWSFSLSFRCHRGCWLLTFPNDSFAFVRFFFLLCRLLSVPSWFFALAAIGAGHTMNPDLWMGLRKQ